MRITDQTIKSLIIKSTKDKSKKYIFHNIGENLWLRVSTTKSTPTWVFRFCIKDATQASGYKSGSRTIGKYPKITLKQACEISDELNEKLKLGISQLSDKRDESITLLEVWNNWLNASELGEPYRKKCEGMFKYHLAKFSETPLKQITDKIAWDKIIKPILDAGHKRQAKHVLGKLKQITRFARETYLIDFVAFDLLKMPNQYKVKRERTRTLDTTELEAFLKALEFAYEEQIIDMTNHHLLKLILLLGTRKSELALLTRDKYNTNNNSIVLTETKNSDNLIIRLPKQAIVLFQELMELHRSNYIFPSIQKHNHHICIRSILYNLQKVTKIANINDFCVHDLRRTFSSRLTGLRFRLELIEKATNHRLQGTAKHYQHDSMLEERFEMLEHWANYLDSLMTIPDEK